MKPSFILSVMLMALRISSSIVECALQDRNLQTFEYVDPPWWELISRDFEGISLRKCVNREFPPPEGASCPRNPRTCYFGNQECPRVGPYPTRECFCNGDGVARGTWSCIDQECPEGSEDPTSAPVTGAPVTVSPVTASPITMTPVTASPVAMVDLVPSASPSASSVPTVPDQRWRPLGQTVIGAGPDGSNFGERVALSADGLTLAASAKSDVDPSTGLEVGSVTTYRLIGNTWTQFGSTLYGAVEDAKFGEDMDISADGNTLVVGADCVNDCDGESTASIFRFNEAQWNLVAPPIGGLDSLDGIGIDVSADGSIIVIAAEAEEELVIFSNLGTFDIHVQIFDETGAESAFGSSIAVSGDGSTIAVGAIEAQNSDGVNVGSVSIYGRIPNATLITYELVQVLEGFEVLEGDGGGDFGTSVALNSDGNILAIGDDRGGDFGEVRVYSLQNSVWTQLGQTLGGDAISDNFCDAVSDNFGDAVSLNAAGDILAVGADGGFGFVRVFRLVGNTWTPLGRQLSGEFESDKFGSEISLSATGFVLAVGVEGDGAVRAFRYA